MRGVLSLRETRSATKWDQLNLADPFLYLVLDAPRDADRPCPKNFGGGRVSKLETRRTSVQIWIMLFVYLGGRTRWICVKKSCRPADEVADNELEDFLSGCDLNVVDDLMDSARITKSSCRYFPQTTPIDKRLPH
jgi:hypothetical protein